MSAAATALAPVAEQKTDAAIIDDIGTNPGLVLTDPKQGDAFFAAIKRVTLAEVSGLSATDPKQRDLIKSTAYKITRTKTAIDKKRKEMTAEWREQTNAVNARGKLVTEQFDALAAEVRKPVTEWEEAEEGRRAEANALLERINGAAMVSVDETAADVQARLDDIRGINLNPEMFGARMEIATDAQADTVKALSDAVERIKTAEAERAELEALRRERAEREEREAAERREREQAEAEQRRAEAEAEQRERDRREAADRARREAEEAAQRARDDERAEEQRQQAERDRAAQAKIEAANARAAEAERKSREEQERAERERQEREAEQQRIADEKAKREADEKHRSAVMTRAKQAIMTCGVDEETARKVVMLIKAGEVPAVSIAF